jgi:hypothetical protein
MTSARSHFVRLAFAVAVAAVALTFEPSSMAVAAWSATGSGAAAGAATAMPTGLAPSGSASGDAVTLGWAAATFPDGTLVAGYTVTRTDALNGAQAAAGGTCAGIVATTTCTDQPVPAGTWTYADTPVQLSWTGGQSPPSNQIVTLT